MKEITKPDHLLDRLRKFEVFAEVSDDALRWLVDKSRYIKCEKDTFYFREGDTVNYMQVIVEGSYVIRRESNGRRREMGIWKAPYVSGILPFSRMQTAGAEGLCLTDLKVLELHRDHFVEMVNVSYELTQALVSVMTNRVRDFQQMRLMDEKLMALGKMSAGLAHELNNPASAMVRSSQELQRHLKQTPTRFKDLVTMRVSSADVDKVNAVLFERIEASVDTEDLTLLEREERTDELLDWFADNDIDNADDLADTLVDWDFRTDHLTKIAASVPTDALSPVIGWIETSLTTESLVREIQTASGRISSLVTSIKTYSYMDRDPALEMVDVHEGIKSTVTMLYHGIKKKGIELTKELDRDIPKIKALAGELNQVWTNLLSNALDALPERGGRLTIRTYQERDCVCVEVEDNGAGVPEELKTRVFEPFFTTKGIGEGTGMGLDIVRRVVEHHNGSVGLESEPGRTVFQVCFPVGKNSPE